MQHKNAVLLTGGLWTLLLLFSVSDRTADASGLGTLSNAVPSPTHFGIKSVAAPTADLEALKAAVGSSPDQSKPELLLATPTPAFRVFLPMVAMQSSVQAASASKRGVGTPSPYQYCDDLTKLRATWFFDWSIQPPACNGVENVPMIWGRSIPNTVQGNSPWLMVWNEPNNPGQANLSPADAASLFPTIEQRFSNRKLLVGNTYDGYGGFTPGIQWLSAFIDAYNKANGRRPRLDGIGMHCYQWTALECIQTTQQFVQLASQVGAEVWVTEFAFYQGYDQRSEAQVGQELESYLGYLNSEPRVTRYAWFANRIYGTESWANPPGWNSPLINSNGVTTTYGVWYVQ